MSKREFFVHGRYEFMHVVGHRLKQGSNTNVDRFLALDDNFQLHVMKPMYGHFGPSDEHPKDIEWVI